MLVFNNILKNDRIEKKAHLQVLGSLCILVEIKYIKMLHNNIIHIGSITTAGNSFEVCQCPGELTEIYLVTGPAIRGFLWLCGTL